MKPSCRRPCWTLSLAQRYQAGRQKLTLAEQKKHCSNTNIIRMNLATSLITGKKMHVKRAKKQSNEMMELIGHVFQPTGLNVLLWNPISGGSCADTTTLKTIRFTNIQECKSLFYTTMMNVSSNWKNGHQQLASNDDASMNLTLTMSDEFMESFAAWKTLQPSDFAVSSFHDVNKKHTHVIKMSKARPPDISRTTTLTQHTHVF